MTQSHCRADLAADYLCGEVTHYLAMVGGMLVETPMEAF